MASQKFKQRCIELRQQDYTLKEISEILNRSKTSVFFHIKDIPKTSILLAKIKKENIMRLNRIRPDLKGVSWKKRHCKRFTKWNTRTINLIGHIIFDGELRTTSVFYNNRSTKLTDDFKSNMKIICNFEPKVYLKSGGVIRLSYNSVELADFIRKKKVELLGNITLSPKEHKRSFLKAFFDDEGCVTFKKGKRIVRGYQYNDEILFLVQKLLKNFEIESKVSNRFHEIVISRKKNLKKFAREINFSPGLKINGERSNSIWKESLEKRQILQMAINSYL